MRTTRTTPTAEPPNRWFVAAAVLLGCLVAAPGVSAAGDDLRAPRRAAGRLLQLDPHVDLEAVQPAEIRGGARLASARDGAVTTRFEGGRLTADCGVLVHDPMTTVRRHVDAVWQIPVDAATEPHDLQVEHTITSPGGTSGRLALPDHPESEILVRVRPTSPALARGPDGREVIRGGLVLELDLSGIRYAGTYSGTLTTTVNRL